MPYRPCQALRRNKKRCRRHAMRGSNFCPIHGGRRSARYRVRIDHLPRFYSKHLAGALSDYVAEVTDCPPQEQLNLYEELALMRHAALTAVAMYNGIVNAAADGKPMKPEMILDAAAIMKSWLQEVVKVADTAAKIEAAAKDKVSVQALHMVVNQIVRVAYDAFGDDPRAQVFEQMVRQRVRMPQLDGQGGTGLTPDQDARDMDASVPSAPLQLPGPSAHMNGFVNDSESAVGM